MTGLGMLTATRLFPGVAAPPSTTPRISATFRSVPPPGRMTRRAASITRIWLRDLDVVDASGGDLMGEALGTRSTSVLSIGPDRIDVVVGHARTGGKLGERLGLARHHDERKLGIERGPSTTSSMLASMSTSSYSG